MQFGVLNLVDGRVILYRFKTNKEMTKAIHKQYPELKEHKLIYGNYMPNVKYNLIGELWFSEESSVPLIVHELYHLVRHHSRLNTFSWFGLSGGTQSKKNDEREEREALMMDRLLRKILGLLNRKKRNVKT